MNGEMLSIIALYNFDEHIFDDLTLPAVADLDSEAELVDVIVPLDKATLVENILFECGELSLVYTDPDVVKRMIKIWSAINKSNWTALWETMLYRYNPIWNKDGTYSEARSLMASGTSGLTRTTGNTRTDNLSAKHTGTVTDAGSTSDSGSSSATTTHSVTGFDTSTYSPSTQDSTSGNYSDSGTNGNTRTYNDTVANTGTVQDAGSQTDSGTSSNTESETVSRTEKGNIGVTTTQAMIREQREVVQFNLYEFITAQFKERFCIQVY